MRFDPSFVAFGFVDWQSEKMPKTTLLAILNRFRNTLSVDIRGENRVSQIIKERRNILSGLHIWILRNGMVLSTYYLSTAFNYPVE